MSNVSRVLLLIIIVMLLAALLGGCKEENKPDPFGGCQHTPGQCGRSAAP